jgi:hypothetical protein
MSRRLVQLLTFCAVLGAMAPAAVYAQFPTIPPPQTSPRIWVGGGAGILDLQSLVDPASGASWDFGTMFQARASAERAFQNSAAFGLVGTYARGPMTYRGPGCGSCPADITVWQLLGMFRIGGGSGLHQVIEIGGGFTGFSDLTVRNATTPVTGGSITDGTIFIGYGFGYPLGPASHFTLVQELGILFHNSGDSPTASSSNTIRTSTTRVGVRFALGGAGRR